MTAMVASFGFIPMALATGTGARSTKAPRHGGHWGFNQCNLPDSFSLAGPISTLSQRKKSISKAELKKDWTWTSWTELDELD